MEHLYIYNVCIYMCRCTYIHIISGTEINQSQSYSRICFVYYDFLSLLRAKLYMRLVLRISSRSKITIAIKFLFLDSWLCEQQCPCYNFKDVTFYAFKKKEGNTSKRNCILSSLDFHVLLHIYLIQHAKEVFVSNITFLTNFLCSVL